MMLGQQINALEQGYVATINAYYKEKERAAILFRETKSNFLISGQLMLLCSVSQMISYGNHISKNDTSPSESDCSKYYFISRYSKVESICRMISSGMPQTIASMGH